MSTDEPSRGDIASELPKSKVWVRRWFGGEVLVGSKVGQGCRTSHGCRDTAKDFDGFYTGKLGFEGGRGIMAYPVA